MVINDIQASAPQPLQAIKLLASLRAGKCTPEEAKAKFAEWLSGDASSDPTTRALAAALASAKASASEALRALVSDLESAKENNGKSSSSSSSPLGAVNVGAVSASVEVRILEKIMSVCEPSAGAGAASTAAAAAEKGAVGGNDGKRRTAA